MPSIFRNTKLTIATVSSAIGLALVVALYERYLDVLVLQWTAQVFYDFGSVNVFSALAGNQSSIVQSLPMVLAWTVISLICYSFYIFLDYIWSLVKAVVPLEVSKMVHKTDIFDNLILLGATIRIGILLAVASLIPLAVFAVRPLGMYVASLVAPLTADPIYREVWVLVATFPIWLLYFLLLYYVLALITYEKNEIDLEEEHNPLLAEEDEDEE